MIFKKLIEKIRLLFFKEGDYITFIYRTNSKTNISYQTYQILNNKEGDRVFLNQDGNNYTFFLIRYMKSWDTYIGFRKATGEEINFFNIANKVKSNYKSRLSIVMSQDNYIFSITKGLQVGCTFIPLVIFEDLYWDRRTIEREGGVKNEIIGRVTFDNETETYTFEKINCVLTAEDIYQIKKAIYNIPYKYPKHL